MPTDNNSLAALNLVGKCNERELLNRIALNVELRVCDEIKKYKTTSDINYGSIIELIFDTMRSKKECVRDLFNDAKVEQTISKLIFLTLLVQKGINTYIDNGWDYVN